MDELTRQEIERTELYICKLPPFGQVFDNTEGEKQLAYAISLGKTVIVWRGWRALGQPLPNVLGKYPCVVVDGNDEVLAEAVAEVLNLQDGDTVNVTARGWHP
ncbi:MAG: hypothetical protein OXH22_03885 [Chloroflexi bacterium]|nr:hypothetical protein [Chloroflexota bacterium]